MTVEAEAQAATEQEEVELDFAEEQTAQPVEEKEIDEEEIEKMKQTLKNMEEEAKKIQEIQEQASLDSTKAEKPAITNEERDKRSVYVGNVDYGSTAEELIKHFGSCGEIETVTILRDRFTGQPKGFAYIEFKEPTAIASATTLNDSLFRSRQLKVTPKRTNVPGISTTNRGRGRGRGRGFGGFGGFRGGYRGRGGFRGRGRGGYFQPY